MFEWLTHESLILIFFFLMCLSVFLYIVLDGYDLGVGLALPFLSESEKDLAVSSIGPFWDANETWLVLGIGLLLVAFPVAHGQILGGLYLPVFVMLLGLIVRGCAFDFRMKSKVEHKRFWNGMFFAGSWIAASAQGFMLGWWIGAFEASVLNVGFALLIALCLPFGYALLGSGWLVMKTQGVLQEKAIKMMQWSLVGAALGIGAVSVYTPFVSATIFSLWFSQVHSMFILPLLCALCMGLMGYALLKKKAWVIAHSWVLFTCTLGVFLLSFIGLGYSLFPYLVIDKLTIWDAAASFAALKIIFIGTLFVVPTIVLYTIFVYYVFRGKAQILHY